MTTSVKKRKIMSSPPTDQVVDIIEYFNCIRKLAVYNRVLVILQGISGSGKSLLAKRLVSKLIHFTSVQICSTDTYFRRNPDDPKSYSFCCTKLAEYHRANQEAAKISTAQVVIIDNTNLSTHYFDIYREQMPERVLIILATQERHLEILHNRVQHNLSLEQLKKQQDYYQPVRARYFASVLSDASAVIVRQLCPAWFKNVSAIDLSEAKAENKQDITVDPIYMDFRDRQNYEDLEFLQSHIGDTVNQVLLGTWSCQYQSETELQQMYCLICKRKAPEAEDAPYDLSVIGHKTPSGWNLRDFWQENDLQNDVQWLPEGILLQWTLVPLFPKDYNRLNEYKDGFAKETLVHESIDYESVDSGEVIDTGIFKLREQSRELRRAFFQ